MDSSVESLRQYRIAGYALFDFAITFLGVFLLYPLLKKIGHFFKLEIPLKGWLLLSVPLSVVAHVAAGSITPLTEQFIRLDGGYDVKIVIIVLCILGLRTISRRKK